MTMHGLVTRAAALPALGRAEHMPFSTNRVPGRPGCTLHASRRCRGSRHARLDKQAQKASSRDDSSNIDSSNIDTEDSHRLQQEHSETTVQEAESSEYSLSFLWLDKNLAVSVDQVFGRGHRSPVTEYYWWPREDAWENLKQALDEREERDWITSSDKIQLLNTLTDVINYWSAEDKPSVRDAIAKWPGCSFQG
jgi:30S ribosomal protein 3